jgi:hypothetical protein
MADDIINSGGQSTPPAEEKKTVAQQSAEHANRYSEASEVVGNAAAEYQHGKDVNAKYSNSGLNTTVAKDSKGNAIGTYDWEAQAEHTAKISYNSDVLAARQEAAAAKQELIANQQQGQTQHDMAGYSANQSAEKAGWTGGYILDSNRQVAFLKESIKANLYSQEELQKYGYDTALAAARANYDLKKSELAMQNYNTAVQNAFQMAEYTGKFISPETSFHLSQRGVAEQILKDPNATEEDKAKANEVISSVNSWFEGNNISKEGVYCMSVLMNNFAQASEAQNNIANAWDKFNAALASNQEAVDAANKEASRTGIFSYVDEYGDVQKVPANWAVAMTEGKMPEGFENWSTTVQAEYKSILGNAIAGDLKGKIEANDAISGKDFADEASAKNAVHNAIVDSIMNYGDGISDVSVGEINVTVTIKGETKTIPVTAGSLSQYKEKYKTNTDKEIHYNNNSVGSANSSEAIVNNNITWNNDGGWWIFGATETGKDGNNFSLNGNPNSSDGKYRVQYGGVVKATDEDAGVLNVVNSMENGSVFGYKEKVYIYKDGKVCRIEQRGNSYKDHYTELHNQIFGTNIEGTDTALNKLDEAGSLPDEQLTEKTKEYIWSGDTIVANHNGNINHGGNIKLTIDGTEQESTYEYDKDYGDDATKLLKVFYDEDTTSNKYKASKAILDKMDNDSYAVLPMSHGKDTKYVIIVKDKSGHYSFLRAKDASNSGEKTTAFGSDIQKLAKEILKT